MYAHSRPPVMSGPQVSGRLDNLYWVLTVQLEYLLKVCVLLEYLNGALHTRLYINVWTLINQTFHTPLSILLYVLITTQNFQSGYRNFCVKEISCIL